MKIVSKQHTVDEDPQQVLLCAASEQMYLKGKM